MQTDWGPDDSQQPDGTVGTEAKILSTPANKTTPARLRTFLAVYRRTRHVRLSCQAAGIHHNLHYRRLACDPAYRVAFQQVEQGVDHLTLGLFKKFRREYRREKALPEISATVHLMERVEAAEQGVKLIREQRAQKRRA